MACLSLVAVASTALVTQSPLIADGAVQLEMARSFAATKEMRVAGDISHFYPPFYPLVLVVPGLILGFTPSTVHAVQAILCGATVFSTYIVGAGIRRNVGLIGAVLVACNPVLLAEVGEGRATLLAALLLLWMFHFVRIGLTDEARLGWAGLFAGMLYLTKDTAGYVAVLGILAGLGWRARRVGWKAVLRAPHYRLGGAFFVTFAGVWALRNQLYFASPVTNPGMVEFTQRYFLMTSPDQIAILAFGTTALFVVHWLLWTWPALLDPRIGHWVARPHRSLDMVASALLLFLTTTLLLSAIVAGIFIRGQGDRYFPASVEFYFRLLATSDPLLMIAVAWLVTSSVPAQGRPAAGHVVSATKVVVIIVILLSSWPGVVSGAEIRSQNYAELQSFLSGAGVEDAYSEASVLLASNAPAIRWIHVSLDFSGPLLDFQSAGVPDGSTIVTVGVSEQAHFNSGGFSVILNVSWESPPVIRNPFYEP